MFAYIHPYSGSHFFSFFAVLFSRLLAFVQGDLSLSDLVSDEIQLLVLVGIALSCSWVGSFLVLRRMAMLANSLSHTILLGIAIAFALTTPALGFAAIDIKVLLLAAVAMGIVTTLLTELLVRFLGVQEEASVGIVFTTLFALGIVLVTLSSKDAHIGAEVVMGNVDALHLDDCGLVFLVLLFNSFTIFLFFKEYLITTFDASFSRSLGFSPSFFQFFLMLQTSVTLVAAFRAVGVLMVLAFLTAPPLTARLLTNRLKPLLAWASLIGTLASLFGVALSRHLLSVYRLPLSTAGIVVLCLIFLFLLVVFVRTVFTQRLLRSSAR